MADIDYMKLFENGQLIVAEPEHKIILDRMYQSYKGFPEEQIFVNKYRSYLEKYHPEALAPVAVPVVLSEESVPVQEVPVEIAEEVKEEVLEEAPIEVPVEEISQAEVDTKEMTDAEVDAFIESHEDIKVHHLAGSEKRRQAVLDYLASQQ